MKNKELYKQIQSLKDIKIQVGWFEDAVYDNGEKIGGIMAVQNFGATIHHPGGQPYFKDKNGELIFVSKNSAKADKLPKTKPHIINIPATHFMNKCFDNNKDNWVVIYEKALKRYFENKISFNQIYQQLQLMMETNLKESIDNVNEPPLSPSTIKARNNRYKNKEGGDIAGLTKRLINTGKALNTINGKTTIK